MNYKNIKNDSFSIAKTGIIDSQKCLEGTLKAILSEARCLAVENEESERESGCAMTPARPAGLKGFLVYLRYTLLGFW
jgi:hypothetical protein